MAADPGAGTALNAVQVSIQTGNLTSVSSYDLVAYNSTGSPVASYTGQYQLVTLDLPSGTYLLAATAYGSSPPQPPVCCGCAQPEGVSSSTEGAGSARAASSDIALPCYLGSAPEEYGYSLTQVSGPASITIDTLPPSEISTTSVSVSVSYENGTAVSGADVSASVVGADLNWGANSSLSMYTQTSADGVAQMVVPALPLEVSASDSVQVNLTQSQTVVQVNVGGQLVNVTVYYSPNYVYLSGSALLLPPQASTSVVLTAQQPLRVPYMVSSADTAASPDSQPGQASQGSVGQSVSTTTSADELASIPPIPASDLVSPAAARPSPSPLGVSSLELGTLALAGALAAVAGVAISKKR